MNNVPLSYPDFRRVALSYIFQYNIYKFTLQGGENIKLKLLKFQQRFHLTGNITDKRYIGRRSCFKAI
jgi:hypothetical protein